MFRKSITPLSEQDVTALDAATAQLNQQAASLSATAENKADLPTLPAKPQVPSRGHSFDIVHPSAASTTLAGTLKTKPEAQILQSTDSAAPAASPAQPFAQSTRTEKTTDGGQADELSPVPAGAQPSSPSGQVPLSNQIGQLQPQLKLPNPDQQMPTVFDTNEYHAMPQNWQPSSRGHIWWLAGLLVLSLLLVVAVVSLLIVRPTF